PHICEWLPVYDAFGVCSEKYKIILKNLISPKSAFFPGMLRIQATHYLVIGIKKLSKFVVVK
ncbi:MAG: hypothetical protein ACPMAG_11315, partial [Limisphaerales bacterium]